MTDSDQFPGHGDQPDLATVPMAASTGRAAADGIPAGQAAGSSAGPAAGNPAAPGAGSPAGPGAGSPAGPGAGSPAGPGAGVDHVADMVLARIREKLDEGREPSPTEIPSAEHAIALREQAPELYDLWLRIAQEKAATENYVDRAPYEVPERLAQSGRPRALGALIIVLSFCGYLAWLGGPGPYIGGLIAVLDLGAMFGMFFGLRPESLPEQRRPDRKRHLPPGPGKTRSRYPRAASGPGRAGSGRAGSSGLAGSGLAGSGLAGSDKHLLQVSDTCSL